MYFVTFIYVPKFRAKEIWIFFRIIYILGDIIWTLALNQIEYLGGIHVPLWRTDLDLPFLEDQAVFPGEEWCRRSRPQRRVVILVNCLQLYSACYLNIKFCSLAKPRLGAILISFTFSGIFLKFPKSSIDNKHSVCCSLFQRNMII